MDIFALQFQTLKEMLNWRVSLDIILIGFGIFFLYRTFKTAGTTKIVYGILIAGFIFILARILDLKGIEWIYLNLSEVLVIAFIVIFQPELRKIFERAASITRKEYNVEGTKISFVLSDAIFSLAEQKRGAILVFPGKDTLKSRTSEGIKLEASISYPLLMSIFDPHSPGHDGAAIIENAKISSFAVRLPLSKSAKLSHEYGTRHHAGMGLSEQTDALIVVVSEERGKISLFSQSIVRQVSNKSELASVIMEHWRDTASYSFLNNNKKNKKRLYFELGISFLIAFFFWSTVLLTQIELRDITYTLPIEYNTLPDHAILKNQPGKEVTVTFLGSISELSKLNPKHMNVFVDLSNVKNGINRIRLTRDMFILPNNIIIKEVHPSYVMIDVIKTQEIQAVIQPQIIGSVPKGFRLKSFEVVPDTINIYVPVSTMSETNISIFTTPIYLESVTETIKLYCYLIIPKYLRQIKQDWPFVEVNLEIERDNK